MRLFEQHPDVPELVELSPEGTRAFIASVIAAEPETAAYLLQIVLSGAMFDPEMTFHLSRYMLVTLTQGVESARSLVEVEAVAAGVPL